jgi:hypothetical protein
MEWTGVEWSRDSEAGGKILRFVSVLATLRRMGGEPSAHTGADAEDRGELRKAWEAHEAEIRAVVLPDPVRVHPNGNVVQLAAHVLAVAEVLRPHLEEIQARAPGIALDAGDLDRLASVARATLWISLDVASNATVILPVQPLVGEARATRERLEPALRAKLAMKPASSRRSVPTLVGRRPADWGVLVQSLIVCLRAEGLDGTPLTPEDLDTAARLAARLVTTTTTPRLRSPAVVEARLLRRKALVLLRDRYEAVRAVVLFAFRKEAAGGAGIWTKVPSFWQARRGKGEGGK